MILIIDNYDSFVYNIYNYISYLFERYYKKEHFLLENAKQSKYETIPEEKSADSMVKIIRNNKITIEEIIEMNPDGIILSPGPGNPANERDFGVCSDIIDNIKSGKLKASLLGVCLGHQGIVHKYGGKIIRAREVVHGKTDTVYHNGDRIFKSTGSEFPAGRYHSLTADKEDFPGELQIIAKSRDGEIMAVKHKEKIIYGLQFHPESVLTPDGYIILRNFLNMCISDRIKN